MKTILSAIGILITLTLSAQSTLSKQLDPTKKVLIVEASCGQCQFKMKGKGCTLAVRINNVPYFVDKSDIEQFGDAHAKMGFCNAIRKAFVTGKIHNNKFVASSFVLIDK